MLDNLILVYIAKIIHKMGFPNWPLIEFVVFLGLLIVIGLFGGNFIGRKTLALVNFIINNIPYVRAIYSTFQKILETAFQNKQKAFSQVALVEYPRKGLYSMGFITADTKGAIREKVNEDLWSIFVPTTPNPTSGVLIFAPKKDVQILDLTIDQAAKLIMSAGVIDEKEETATKETLAIEKLPSLFKRKKETGMD